MTYNDLANYYNIKSIPLIRNHVKQIENIYKSKKELYNNVVNVVFPSLNHSDKHILAKYLANIIEIIFIKFDFKNVTLIKNLRKRGLPVQIDNFIK